MSIVNQSITMNHEYHAYVNYNIHELCTVLLSLR